MAPRSSSPRTAAMTAEYEPGNTEIYEVPAAGGAVKQLTNRFGPDADPVVSPDGKLIAYTGFDDRHQGYQVTKLYVMNRDGSGVEARVRLARPRHRGRRLEPGRQGTVHPVRPTRGTRRSATSRSAGR